MSIPSRRSTFRDYLKQLPKALLIGFLQAIGILRLPNHKGAYWARKESTGEWELRVPYKSGQRPF